MSKKAKGPGQGQAAPVTEPEVQEVVMERQDGVEGTVDTDATTMTVEVPAEQAKVEAAPRVTIKSVIVTGLRNGLGTKEITALLQDQFPASAAARKAVKHIAWYRSRLRQEAKAAVAAITAAQGAAA
jgi:hypothetical protein